MLANLKILDTKISEGPNVFMLSWKGLDLGLALMWNFAWMALKSSERSGQIFAGFISLWTKFSVTM